VYPLASYPPAYAVPGDPSGYPEYAVPGYQGAAIGYAPRPTNGLSIAAMTVSIVGLPLLTCYGIGLFVSLAGAIMGHIARRQVKDRGDAGGGMALAGIIVGWIGVGLGLLIIGAVVFFFFAMAASSPR